MLLSYSILNQLSLFSKPAMLRNILETITDCCRLLSTFGIPLDSNNIMSTLTIGCLSTLQAVEHKYTWKIENFHYWPETSKNDLTTPEFSIKILDRNLKCNIKICHKQTLNQFNELLLQKELNLSICFKHNLNTQNIQIHVQISVLNNQSEVYKMFKKWCYLDNRSTIIDWFEFLKHNEIMASGNNLLNNNALTICFEFIIPTGINNTLQNKTVASNEVGCRIILDLEDLFKSKKYSDFIITASCGQRFEVHKVILAARCNIFAAMFDSDMLERRENKVDISDIDGKTMYQLLSFIYTGQVNLHQDNALQVMQASEKYNIIDLKQKCEIILWESVSIENVAEIFTIANICNAKQLKNKCLNFMAENQKDVIKTSGFKTMAKRDDVDLSEMLSYFVK